MLKKDNYIPYVIIEESKGSYINQLKQAGVKLIISKNIQRNFNLIKDLKGLIFIIKTINSLRPALVSSHSFKAGLLLKSCSFFIKDTPTIFTAHGWSFSEGIPYFRRIISLFIESILCNKVNRVITVCESDYKLALKKNIVDKNKLINIYNGMHLKDYKLRKYQINKIVKFISVARFEKQKDHYNLIKSFSLIRNKHWELYLIGEGPNLGEIIKLVHKSGLEKKIFFLGAQDNVEKYLNKSDVFILSSLWEGFPRSILEAMRSSMPVISTNVGGCKESVIDGYNGFLIEPQNRILLSNKIELFLNDRSLIQKFGTRSFERFCQNFTFDKMYNKTKSVYKELEK